MERTYRTRILVSPSLSAPINEVDCGGFVPFPSLLTDQTSASSAISFSASDRSFHPFMMIEKSDPAGRAMIPASTSFKIDSTSFFQLPTLLSLKPVQDPTVYQSVDHFSLIQSSPPRKKSRPYSQFWRFPQQLVESGKNDRRAPPSRSTERSRQRRQIISERTRILEKLMPWERRLDTGTMLEEAFKYVKFLEAQVTALEAMPVVSRFMPSAIPPGNFLGFERLTRQQLLQVMVTSAVVQDVLYKKGFCVVAAEQVAMLRNANELRLQPLLLLGHLGSE